MDGCSQMVFCTHLSDTADRGREEEEEEETGLRAEEQGGRRGGGHLLITKSKH